MLIMVPKGKRVYFGKFRMIEGEILPLHVAMTIPDDLEHDSEIVEEIPEIIEDEVIEKPKRKYVKKAPSIAEIPDQIVEID